MAKSSKGRPARGGGRGPKRGGGGGARASRPQTKRHYPRTARLNTLLQEIVAGFMEKLDDDRIGFVTITGVEVDNDLNRAEVFISTLEPLETPEAEEEYLDAITEYRKPIKAQIAREARIRKTPEVVFSFDPAVRAGARIEEILSSLGDLGGADDESTESTEDDTVGESAEGQSADGEIADGDSAEGQSADGVSADGQSG